MRPERFKASPGRRSANVAEKGSGQQARALPLFKKETLFILSQSYGTSCLAGALRERLGNMLLRHETKRTGTPPKNIYPGLA